MTAVQLRPGLTGSAEIVVGEQHTAPHVGSGAVHVLATPVMILAMENAALNAIRGYLGPGESAVGIAVDVRHIAATPVGQRVTADAEVTKVDGRRLVFTVTARDETEEIGRGTHERMVIDLLRLEQRLEAKMTRSPADPGNQK